jgi:N-acetylglucosamine-6-phosphate deacetylase
MEELLLMMPPVKGFVDLQVNGFLGVDFSAPGLGLEQVRRVVSALRERGTVAFCPTLITAPMELYEQNLPVLARAMSEPDLSPHLLGVHLEGPFISPRDGARGAHPALHVQLPSIPTYDRLQELAAGRILLVTLAPEQPAAEELIRYVRSSGPTVSLGHHLADHNTITRACDNGAVASTHLGNGIPNHLPRHPNPIWDQLDEQRLAAMLIVDGHHLPSSFVRVVVRVKTSRRVIVVSDAAPIAGLPPGKYETLGQEVILEQSGRIWNLRGNHLVGSSACMMDCMNHFASLNILSETELWQVGYHNPLELIQKKLDARQFSKLPDVSYRNGIFERGKAS